MTNKKRWKGYQIKILFIIKVKNGVKQFFNLILSIFKILFNAMLKNYLTNYIYFL